MTVFERKMSVVSVLLMLVLWNIVVKRLGVLVLLDVTSGMLSMVCVVRNRLTLQLWWMLLSFT